MIIAIDGPAASGKSTISKTLAQKLSFIYFSTGTMYRAITAYFLINNFINKKEKILSELKNIRLDICNIDLNNIKVNDSDYSKFYYSPEVNKNISDISSILEVRNKMVALQRQVSNNTNLVCEGRDIGTVVFPNAEFKFYIDADVECRVNRRYSEISKNKQSLLNKDELKKLLINRDYIDKNREVSPLKVANDAFHIDTTNLSINEVVNIMYNKINGVPNK